MLPTQIALIAFALAAGVLGFPSTPFKARIVSREEIQQSYDYVVIGGGTSGLTVADRLTEDPRSACGYPSTFDNLLSILIETVLVIESAQLDQREDAFLVPGYFGTAPPKYFYNLTSIPQPENGNRTFGLQAGFVVGGGSAVNGMFFDRGCVALHAKSYKLNNAHVAPLATTTCGKTLEIPNGDGQIFSRISKRYVLERHPVVWPYL